jgi:hypothetical protein
LATVLADTLNPNLANSAWIRFFGGHAPDEGPKLLRKRAAITLHWAM